MKACLQLQRRFAYVGHAMAIAFKERYGIKDFCGYVYLRPSLEFLKSQTDIKYSGFLLDEEMFKKYKDEKLDLNFLKNLEKEYGLPNLWPYIELDRVVRYNLLLREYPHDTPYYSHEEMMRILQAEAKAMIKFIDDEKPDFIIFSVIASIGSLLLYSMAKKRGVRTFLFRTARVGTKYSITEDYNKMDYIEKTFSEIKKGGKPYQDCVKQAEEFLKKFRDNPSPHSVMDTPKKRPITRQKQFNFLAFNKIFKSAGWFIKSFYVYFSDKNRNDHSTIKPWHIILDRIKRKVRVLIGFGDFYDEIDLSEDFAFFPLHLEPEMAVSLFAPFYTDQIWLIKQIARSLPVHYKLYVKEHPAMFGYRPRRYYKELKKIPNVKLIKPAVVSFDLIKNAKLLVTLSSTAGWEALLLKKPLVTFGNGLYNTISMVKKCDVIENLPQIIKEQLENFHYDENELISFIAAIFKESADINLVQIWDIEGDSKMEEKKEAVIPLVDLIASKLNLKPII